MNTINPESAVRQRYAAGAKGAEAKLCCPVDYDTEYLKVIPQEVIDRDYGCGDPNNICARLRSFSISAAVPAKFALSPRRLSGLKEKSSASI